jgi:hypothetical protein
MKGKHLDLSSEGPGQPVPGQTADSRRFLGVQFACCDVYSRIYINRAGSAYEGNCPKCGKRLKIGIGPGGTGDRFFIAY